MPPFAQKLKFLRDLWHGELASAGPFHVTLYVTRRCNLRCSGCRYHSPVKQIRVPGDHDVRDLSPELAGKIIADLSAMGVSTLELSGEGEPLLHPRIFDYIALAKKAGLTVMLLTNGTLLNDVRLQKLLDSGLDLLKVTLWANTPEGFSRINPGSPRRNFDRALAGLQSLAGRREREGWASPRVVLHQVINRHNHGSLERTVALSRQLGVDGLSFSPFKAWGPEMAEAALTLAEEKAVGRTLRRLRRQAQGTLPRLDVDQALMAYRFARTAETAPPCYVGFTNIRIRVDGTVVPCQSCNLIMGHAGEAGLKEIWNGPQYREFRRQTRSRAGLAALAPSCDCSYCCSTRNNVRIHRFFRWLAPFSRGVRT